jgi:hypothetical protein
MSKLTDLLAQAGAFAVKSWHGILDAFEPALQKVWEDFKEHLPAIEAAALSAAVAAAQGPSDKSKSEAAYEAAKGAAITSAISFGLDEAKVLGSARIVAVNAMTKATAEPPPV